MNTRALVAVDPEEDTVALTFDISGHTTLRELEALVTAEQSCCGAAGVSFSLTQEEGRAVVRVDTARSGLPARTVLAAFSAMAPRG